MIQPLFSPLERVLTSGGDTRLEVDPQTGRNRYECMPRPSGAVPFGSCTSSSVSERGFAAALETHRMLCTAPDSRAAADEYAQTLRRRLHDLLALPEGVEVVLAASGTDVEMLALALAAGDVNRPIINIVVGPGEVGSGTPQAAACRHYDRFTPGGRPATVGQPVDARLSSLTTVRTVDLRGPGGSMLAESEIDAAVVEIVAEASETDAVVLLHVVAHSKTGVHAPSLACVERLRQISDDIVVVVDAAQGRFSRRGLRDVLRKDYLVMFTGSKFYGGPPFSGALLVPEMFQPERRNLTALPSGFADYFTAVELPESWRQLRSSLTIEPNYGLLLRWSAAMAEIEAYYQVPNEARLRILRFFEMAVPRIFGESPRIRLLPVFPPVYDDLAERLLESKTTVFGFWVTPPGTPRSLGKAELRQMHVDLATDLAANSARMDSKAMSREYHVGQPVDLAAAGCVLRVALGGCLITRVATDTTIGHSLDDRLQWLERQLFGLRQKVECLAALHGKATTDTNLPANTNLTSPTLALR